MKKLAALLLLILICPTLFAETVFWIGPDPVGKEWSNNDLLAFTDLYSIGSVLSITSEYGTLTAVVAGKLPETVEGRDLALTQVGLTELGLWGQGHTVVSVKLRSGSMLDEESSFEGSGWYSIALEPMAPAKAFEAYRTLSRKGFKPVAKAVEGKVVVYVQDVVAYEKDSVVKSIKALGYKVASEKEKANPYL